MVLFAMIVTVTMCLVFTCQPTEHVINDLTIYVLLAAINVGMDTQYYITK